MKEEELYCKAWIDFKRATELSFRAKRSASIKHTRKQGRRLNRLLEESLYQTTDMVAFCPQVPFHMSLVPFMLSLQIIFIEELNKITLMFKACYNVDDLRPPITRGQLYCFAGQIGFYGPTYIFQ